MVTIVIGALGKIPQKLTQGLDDLEIIGQVKTIKSTAL